MTFTDAQIHSRAAAALAPANQGQSLPALIDRAATALASAKTAAEVLEAMAAASLAYAAADTAARMARLKRAGDEVIATAYRAQADALEIEAQAKRQLAEAYDAAQERGEVAGHGGARGNQHTGAKVPVGNVASLGLSRKLIHEGRAIAAAEAASPGVVRQTLDAQVEARMRPTRATIKSAVAREKPSTPHRRKPLALDMRSAVEALMASDPAVHREFTVAASEQLTDVDTICAVLRALLSRKHPKNVASLLIDDVFDRPFAKAVADTMIEILDAQEEDHAEAALLSRESR
jgi:hypothetical protein